MMNSLINWAKDWLHFLNEKTQPEIDVKVTIGDSDSYVITITIPTKNISFTEAKKIMKEYIKEFKFTDIEKDSVNSTDE